MSQRLTTGELVFEARKVRAFAASRFHVQQGICPLPSQVAITNNELRSPEFLVKIDPRSGAITSVFSRKLKRELVDASREGLNSYQYLRGNNLKDLQRNGRVKISVKESGPLVGSLLIESEAPGCAKLRREVQLIAGLDRVNITDEIDKLPVRDKEGIHFGFSFNVPNGELRMDVPWAVVRPELDQIAGACKNWFTVQRWVDIANRDFGVTWATPDAPLVEMGSVTANLIGSLSDPKVWMDHVSPSQTIYSWAMNNHWHTKYRAEQEGPTIFRFSVRAHPPASPDEAARFGIACAQPLVVTGASQKKTQPPRLKISAPGVLVSALKPAEEGRALIVRLFAASGRPERAQLKWSEPKPKAIWISDASEKPVRPCSGALEIPAYGVITLRAEL
jgi:alpha-mannosidase